MERVNARASALVFRSVCATVLLGLLGCGGLTGGFPSGLGGGLVNGTKRAVSALFEMNSSAPGAQLPSGDIPLIPTVGATKAYVSIQGAGYQGSDIHFKPISIRTDQPPGFTATVTAGVNSATQTLDNVTGLLPGMWLQFQSPPPKDTGLRMILAVNGDSVVLSSPFSSTTSETVVTAPNQNYGDFVQLKVPTGTADIDDPMDPGDVPRLFNMGSIRRIFVEYRDDQGAELGIATFTITKDPTGPIQPLELNSGDRLDTSNGPPDLSAHEGRIVDLPVDVSNLPRLTTVGQVQTADLGRSLVFTAEEVGDTHGLDKNKFIQILNITPDLYTGERTISEQNVLIADRHFEFQLTVEVRAGFDGQGALLGSSGPVDLGQLPLQLVPSAVTLHRAAGTVLLPLSNPFLFTISQNAPISAYLLDADGNQTTFVYRADPNNPNLPLDDPTRALNYDFVTEPADLMGPSVPPIPGKFMATGPGFGTIKMTVAAEADQQGNPDEYYFSTGQVPLQVFSIINGLVISNYKTSTITLPRTVDATAADIVHIDLALVDQSGVQTVLPQPYNNQADPFYTDGIREVLIQTNPPGKPDITDPSRRPNWLAPEDPNNPDPDLATEDSQLRFRASGVTNNASADIRDHELPLTIRYIGFGAPNGELDVTVTLKAVGGTASSGGGGIR